MVITLSEELALSTISIQSVTHLRFLMEVERIAFDVVAEDSNGTTGPINTDRSTVEAGGLAGPAILVMKWSPIT